MPRSITTSRVIVEGTINNAAIPASDNDMVTVALDVPRRGYIHRVTLIWGKSTAFAFADKDGTALLHTVCGLGEGAAVSRLLLDDLKSVFAQAIINPHSADKTGGKVVMGTDMFTWAPVLDFAPGMYSSEGTTASGGGASGIFYDASLGKLGPNEGGATLFFTWANAPASSEDLSANALFCKVRLEIEPVQ